MKDVLNQVNEQRAIRVVLEGDQALKAQQATTGSMAQDVDKGHELIERVNMNSQCTETLLRLKGLMSNVAGSSISAM